MKRINNVKRVVTGRLSLSRFMSLLISVLFLILMLSNAIVFTGIYRNSLYQTATLNSQQAVSQVANTIEIYADEMKNDLMLVQKEIERCQTRNEINRYLNSMVQIQSNLVSLVIYDEDGNVVECGTSGKMLKGSRSSDLSFLPELFEQQDYEMSAPHVQNIFEGYYPWVSSVGIPMDLDVYGGKVYLVMDVRFFSILSYVDSVSIGQHGYCFVIDDEGNLVYHPQQQLIYAGLKKEDLEELSGLKDGVEVSGDVIYSLSTLENGYWRVVGVSYTDEMIQDKMNHMLGIFGISVCFCILIALVTILLFTRKVSKPVRDMVGAMREFEQNAQSFQFEAAPGIYEVQLLSESFEHMVRMIQQLMERVKKEEISLRKTELKALQTQINPHFLYNTLDSIQWMCEQGEMERAVEMVSALAKLFRISISKGKEFITIENELQHAKNYMVIQSFRYKNQFQYSFEVEEGILKYLCNKITLQPIIENAIIHGIDGMCGEGEIRIRAVEDGDDILFSVSDNGIGMTQEQCAKIIHHDTKDNFGIGIKNVNDRIRIYFGEGYGLKIESELDEGTTIYIRFPKVTQEDIERMNLT